MEQLRSVRSWRVWFIWDIIVPMSRANIAALFVILFIYGWNQYLWPLLITTNPEMNTIVRGIKQMFPSGDDVAEWPVIMAASILVMIPPLIVVVSMQKLIVRGLSTNRYKIWTRNCVSRFDWKSENCRPSWVLCRYT